MIRDLLTVSPFIPSGEAIFLEQDEETPMRRPLFSIAAASLLLAGVGVAAGSDDTTTDHDMDQQ